MLTPVIIQSTHFAVNRKLLFLWKDGVHSECRQGLQWVIQVLIAVMLINFFPALVKTKSVLAGKIYTPCVQIFFFHYFVLIKPHVSPKSLCTVIKHVSGAIILTLLFSQASCFHTPLLITPPLYWTTPVEWIPQLTTPRTGPCEGRCALDSLTSIKDDRLNH